MPYIITTTTPGRSVACGLGASYWIADASSRVAVATLEEARDKRRYGHREQPGMDRDHASVQWP